MTLDEHFATWRRKRNSWNAQRQNLERKIRGQRQQLQQYEDKHGEYQKLVDECNRLKRYISELEHDLNRYGSTTVITNQIAAVNMAYDLGVTHGRASAGD